jgi:ribosomal protein S13
MEGNLRERPRSPNVKRWEQSQLDCEVAMAYFASFCTQPVDGKAIAEFYTHTGSVRTYPEDEQQKHIQNVAQIKGISIEAATALVEKADADQAKENKELKVKLSQQLDSIGNKIEHGIVRANPVEYKLTMKDMETLLIKVIEKGEALKDRMNQLIDRVRRPELQKMYAGTILEVEKQLTEVSDLLIEVSTGATREERETASEGRPVNENDDRSMN